MKGSKHQLFSPTSNLLFQVDVSTSGISSCRAFVGGSRWSGWGALKGELAGCWGDFLR